LSRATGVEVLLATYNGERFLREQVDSILKQDYGDLQVLARDDGSSDGTVEILSQYAQKFPDRFRVLPAGPATGRAGENFLLLMKASTAGYICFADQDDVWLPDKVRRTKQAMDQLESRWGPDIPLLVFTDLRVVDDQLRVLHHSFWAHQRIEPEYVYRLAALLRQNVVTGCTAMLNRILVDLSLRMPKDTPMHDQWIGLLASAMGRVGILKAQTVLYRQHDRNVIGADQRSKSLSAVVRKIREPNARYAQWKTDLGLAKALLKVHGDELSSRNREMLNAFLGLGTSGNRYLRIFTLIRYRFFRKGLLRNVATFVDLWKTKVGI
jgi:glycosyltransferase involved in cell wall biosynthesis